MKSERILSSERKENETRKRTHVLYKISRGGHGERERWREESGKVTINGNNTEGDDDRKRCREVNKVGNRCEKQRGSAGSSPAKYSLI